MQSMQYVAWDTETSGLPKIRNGGVTRENLHKFDTCRMASIAAVKFSSKGRELGSFYAVVKPNGYLVGGEDGGAFRVHGITQEHALEHGRPLPEVLDDFFDFIGDQTNTMVAHNTKFDENVVLSEMYRHDLDVSRFARLDFQCTLKMYKDRFLKPIKLINLYMEIFNKEFTDAHNSLADARACGECYPFLKNHTKELKSIGINKVIIKVSDVAGATGHHPFRKPDEIINELWNKYSPETCKKQTKEQVAVGVLTSMGSTEKILNDANGFKANTTAEVQKKLRGAYYDLERSGLSGPDTVAAKDYIKKTLYTNFGTQNEQRTADEDSAYLIRDDTFYSLDVCEIMGTKYQVVGRIDRLQVHENGSKTIVEIKNRMDGLFNVVRDYEEIQCQTYLQMVPNISFCRLVEQHDVYRKGYLIQKNTEKWKNDILPSLIKFCEFFHSTISKNVTNTRKHGLDSRAHKEIQTS